jgi:hypothetical protein
MAKLRLPLLAARGRISTLGDMVAVVPVALHLRRRLRNGRCDAAETAASQGLSLRHGSRGRGGSVHAAGTVPAAWLARPWRFGACRRDCP